MASEERREIWIYLAAILAIAIALSYLIDSLAAGIPLTYNVLSLSGTLILSRVIYLSVILIAGAYVGLKGLRELILERRFSVEFLMTLAAFGATYLGLLLEGATVLFLYSIAEYFEDYIEDHARKAIEKLSTYMPNKARVLLGNEEILSDVRDVGPGAIILVKPGERLPLDGIVVGGRANVDQSLVTGESISLFRQRDDEVYAGTLDTDGVIEIRVTKRSEETLVSRIARLVMESRARKANIETMVSRFARFYVPILVLLAASVAIFPPRLLGGSFEAWLYKSLVLLVVSCPSAFIISVPATIFTAMALAARKGIVIKGGIYIEKMEKMGTVLFDKTGTLTVGEPELVRECAYSHRLEDEVLMQIAALEQYSNHPLAKAIVEKAEEDGLDFRSLPVQNVKEVAGRGIVGDVNGVRVGVGRIEMLERCDEALGKCTYSDKDKHSKVYAIVGESLVTKLCLVDQLREDAVEAVESLRREGIHTVMLTGDKKEIANDISKNLGVNEVYAELLPQDKLRMLEEFRNKRGLVAMVGDGVNDAPALAASDVGIAMGGSGIDVALESADIVLVKNELVNIPYLHKLSKATMKIARQNIAVSLGVKVLLAGLGFMGLIPLWFAVAAGDDGVTLLLLLNNLRIART